MVKQARQLETAGVEKEKKNRGNTRLDPDHKNHADSTKHKSDLLKICSSLNELHCAKGLSS